MKAHLAIVAFSLVAWSAWALELAVDRNTQMRDAVLENQIERAGLTLNQILAADALCWTTGKTYAPASAGADGNGCVDTNFSRCGKAGKLYAPNAGGRDANNCISFPNIGLPTCPNNSGAISDGSTWVCG